MSVLATTREKLSSRFPTRFDTDQHVQSHQITRSLKFKKRDCIINVAKTKALISCAVTGHELLHEKTNYFHRRKQRRRSAVQ